MSHIIALYGSPRRTGNTSLLLQKAVTGAREAGAAVEEIVLRDLNLSPCLEIYGCRKTGRCVIQDDFQRVYDLLDNCDGIMIASPVFFYSVSAIAKALIDRCQSFWVRKYWCDQKEKKEGQRKRKGMLISVGATRGKRLFDGLLLTIRYFFDTLHAELTEKLLYRELDFEGDVMKHPEYLDEAYEAGKRFGMSLQDGAK